jgi:hypothetical protein
MLKQCAVLYNQIDKTKQKTNNLATFFQTQFGTQRVISQRNEVNATIIYSRSSIMLFATSIHYIEYTQSILGQMLLLVIDRSYTVFIYQI